MFKNVEIVITNNYNIAVDFEYCLLLDTIPAENINTIKGNRMVITYLIKNLPEFFKNRFETRVIINILKNERVCRDKYQNRKSTGTRWLWQQIGIYIKTEKAQEQDGFGNKMKYHFHITTLYKYTQLK